MTLLPMYAVRKLHTIYGLCLANGFLEDHIVQTYIYLFPSLSNQFWRAGIFSIVCNIPFNNPVRWRCQHCHHRRHRLWRRATTTNKKTRDHEWDVPSFSIRSVVIVHIPHLGLRWTSGAAGGTPQTNSILLHCVYEQIQHPTKHRSIMSPASAISTAHMQARRTEKVPFVFSKCYHCQAGSGENIWNGFIIHMLGKGKDSTGIGRLNVTI